MAPRGAPPLAVSIGVSNASCAATCSVVASPKAGLTHHAPSLSLLLLRSWLLGVACRNVCGDATAAAAGLSGGAYAGDEARACHRRSAHWRTDAAQIVPAWTRCIIKKRLL